jgi:hypothetical protein
MRTATRSGYDGCLLCHVTAVTKFNYRLGIFFGKELEYQLLLVLTFPPQGYQPE